MTVVNLWAGALAHDGAQVVAKLSGVSSARLAVDTDPAFGSPAFSAPAAPTSQGVVRLDATGLATGTTYFYAIEEDSALNTTTTGSFNTFGAAPGQPVSFAFAATGDAGADPDFPDTTGSVLASNRVSNPPVCATIRAHPKNPRFTLHMGDITYYDLGSGSHGIVGGGSLANYRRMYDDVLLQTHQHELYRHVPIWHVWDDHDGGPNNWDGELETKQNAADAYRERVPHYGLTDSGAIYQEKQIGRVQVVVLDVRFHRSPNSDPDGPDKTMLGQAQKDWLAGILATSPAEALILVSPVRWLNGSDDSWPGFAFERNEIANLLISTGWADRMVMLNGDAHTVAMDSGINNNWGGFPVYVLAPLDATPSGITSGYNIGISNERAQYGIIEVDDDGTRIEITTTGYVDDDRLFAHTFAVDTAGPGPGPGPEPEPEPEPSPAPIAVAAIRRRITWYGVHAVTGKIIAELPDVRGGIGRLLSAYSSHPLTLPIPLAGPGHIPIQLIEQATQPVTAAIVAVVNDLPVWMGWVLSRRGGTGPELRLGTVTPEGYLRRRRVRDHVLTGVDRADVAATLVRDAGELVGVGTGLGFDLDVTLTGDAIERAYVATDRQAVYEALRELAADGLEFTVDLDWTDSTRTAVRKILRLGPRIGKSADAGGAALFETTASSVFESRAGSEATYELTEDFTSGRYGNHVIAIAPGEGEDQPASAPAIDQAALDGGTPVVEHLLEMSSAATSPAALDRAAAAELARVRRGAEVWDISVRLDAYPRLGVDAQLGDDVAWLLTGHRHPTGVLGSGRMIGYEVDQQEGRWRPILLQPGEEVVS